MAVPIPASMNALTAFKRDITPMTPQPDQISSDVDNMIDTMAWTMLGEAANQGPEGMAAIGHVIVNRGNSGRYSRDLMDVMMQPKQFSTWNSGQGGNNPKSRYPKSSQSFQQARQIAEQVILGVLPDQTGGATHYWSPKGMRAMGMNETPYWAKGETRAGQVALGDHVFLPQHPVPPRNIGPAPVPASANALTQFKRELPRNIPLRRPEPLNLPPIQRSASLPPRGVSRQQHEAMTRLPPSPPTPASMEQRVTARNRYAMAQPPSPRLPTPAAPAPIPMPRSQGAAARFAQLDLPTSIPKTPAEILFEQANFGSPRDGVGAMPDFADIQAMIGGRSAPPLPRPRPQMPARSPLGITVRGGNRSAPAPVPRPRSERPQVSTNGYVYAPSAGGGFTRVGSARPAGMTAQQQYDISAAKARASSPENGGNPSWW